MKADTRSPRLSSTIAVNAGHGIAPRISKSRPKPTLNPDDALDNAELIAWKVGTKTVWVQTRSPQFAKKLGQREDAKLVGWSIAGGYLRIFEFRHGMAWAARLIARYQESEVKAANERKIKPASFLGSREAKIGWEGLEISEAAKN